MFHKAAKPTKKIITHTRDLTKKGVAGLGVIRSRTTTAAHHHMSERVGWYDRWHNWRFMREHHGSVHWGLASVYAFVLLVLVVGRYGVALAADLTDTWNFGTIADFILDNGVEQDGTTVRMKAQSYSTDANTAALYHLDESGGSTGDDASANNNDLTTTGSPGFASGNLNNALGFDGNLQRAVAADSASLSVTGQLSLEAWIKPSSPFSSSSSQTQMIIDKGSYKLGLDRTSGKAFYEIENNNSEQWTKRLGEDQAGSWSFNHASVDAATSYGTDVYIGTGQNRNDAEVWKWNGTTWSKVGGDGLNSSWADQTYEKVYSMITNGTSLYVGLGDTAADAEVWTCNASTGCTTWTKVAGDGVGISAAYQTVQSMNVFGGTLYIGTGTSAGNGDVYRYNGGTSWTQVGGDALNTSWAASTYETVQSLTSDGTYLYAGIGTTINDAEVWRYNGTSWSQIGGDSLNSGWTSGFEGVYSLNSFGGNVYAGLGNTGNDAQVWQWNGTTWAKIAGVGVASTWDSANYTIVYSMANDGTNLYASLGSGSAAAEVWRYNGSSWTQIGGDSLNGSWSTSISNALVWANSKLYSSAWSTTTYGSAYWEYNGSTWTLIGGQYVNNSWGGFGISKVMASTTHNGKAYFGLGAANNTALVYEYDGTTASLVGGNGKNGSWASWTYEQVGAMTSYNGELYVGLGANNGDGEVWKYNGSTWTKVAGDGVNSTWNNSEAQVSSMAVFNGKLYVGLGATNYWADIWQYNGSTWTQVAGEPGSAIGVGVEINGSWKVTPLDVQAMTVWDNKLCAAVAGNSSAQVWCWSGSGNWVLVGGGGSGVSTNGSWAGAANQYMGSLAVYNGKLIAGFSTTTGHISNIWEFNGTTWTKIGGTDLSGSWSDGTYSFIRTLAVYNGKLYAGMGFTGSSSPMADVWRYDGSSWSQVGGDSINNSWPVSQGAEEVNTLLNYKGKLYAGLGFSAGTDPVVYSFGNNGYVESTTSSFAASWQHLAATYDGVNMKIFVNGAQDASAAVAATGVDNSTSLQIGNGFGSGQAGDGQVGFSGQIDEVRISNTARTSFTSKPYTTTEQSVALADAVRASGVASWAGFSASETTNGGTVTYQLSDDDGVTWKYWNGGAWVAATGLTQANSAADINTHIPDFPVTFAGIKWQAVLKGDGTQRVTLNSVTITANSDPDAPSANASNLQASVSNGGSAISGGGWTNGASPYFSWDAATDAASDIYGYCLYLGQTSSDDPVTSKGILGTSPVSTAGKCQYVVSATSLDTATAGVLATPLATSNSSYYLNVKALDKAGNIVATSAQFEFKFDNTAPDVPTFVTAPSEFVSNKEATFTWPTVGGDAASDDHSGLAGLQYRIGAGGSWRGDGASGAGMLTNDGSYTTRNDPDFADIADGNNVFYFRSIDNAGNVSSGFVTATLRLNTGSPSSPLSLTATPSSNTSNSFAFSWTPPGAFAGSASALTYCYTVNTLPTDNTCTYTAAGVTSVPAGAYATQPGSNTFYVVAKDNNVNYATAASVTFTANTSAPGIPLDLEIADISTRTTSAWKLALSWSAPTDVGAGVASYRVLRSPDNVTFTQVASTAGTSYVDSDLTQDTYYYKIRACDSANNCGAYSSVVNELPTGRFTSPANQTAQAVVSNISTRKATIRWATDRVSDSKISIGTKSGSYEPFQIASPDQVTDHVVELGNLTAGTTYYAKATWTDEDGNTGMSNEFSFRTADAPSTQESLTTRVGLSSAQIRFTSVSAARVVIQYGKSDSFGGSKEIATSLSRSTYDIELVGLDDATKYYYRLNTYDADGNEYIGSTVLTFTTPARPRISDLRFEPVTGEPTSTQRVTWTTNVDTTSSVTYGKEGTNGTDILNSTLTREHEIIIRGLDDNSVYFLIAQSRDAGGNLAASDRQTFKTALDTRPPKISNVAVETIVKGTGSEARGQIIVTWSTDEPATSQVAFGEGSNSNNITSLSTEDANLTTEHVVIISDLSPAQVYNVQAVSRDNARNEAKSEGESAIINRATDSILSIIVNVLQQIFGFEVQ